MHAILKFIFPYTYIHTYVAIVINSYSLYMTKLPVHISSPLDFDGRLVILCCIIRTITTDHYNYIDMLYVSL